MANIKVAVRVRPISEREIHLTGSEIVVHTEPKAVALTNLKVPSNKAGDSRERTRRYGFDYCFDSSDPTSENYASQETIYETLGETILDALFKRYNSCLVAYGQSASGKTYTMMGSKEDPGLTPRVCEGLFFRLANEEKSNGNFNVSVSYLEVYNERVRDLLRPSSNCVGLRVREHPRLGPYVQGLTHHAVSTLGSLISRVEEGTRARKTASTLQNPTSSRSHALLTLSLLPTSDNSGPSVTVSSATSNNVPRRNDFPRGSKLHLVDLAGSESAAACGGVNRLKEGANINKSLVALGNVISALADRGLARSSPGRRFIPYRDSALTWLLKDVLGGNATTVMLATISPASGSYNETSHTLRFAQRAQSVINRPVINEDPVSRIIRELRAEVARLKSLLLEKNVNTDLELKSSCSCHRDQEQEASNGRPESGALDSNEREEEEQEEGDAEEPIKINQSRILDRRHSTCSSPVLEKELPSPLKRFGSFENPQESRALSWQLNVNRYNEVKVSEVFVNDEVDEPVFVDIPTLVAVLIKPDETIQVDSHQIEEICSDGVLENAIDTEFQKNVDRSTLPSSNNLTNSQIEERQSEDHPPSGLVDFGQFPPNSETPLEATSTPQKGRTKLRKQDSIDSDLTSKKFLNLQTLKKYGSIESLPRKTEICPIQQPLTNSDKRNGSLEKIKKLNNIKEVDDQKLNKLGNSWKNLGWAARDSQQKGSGESDKSLKDYWGKSRNQQRKQSIDGLKRKTSKDSSSSGSKDELVTLLRDKQSRKGSLEHEQIPPRVHTPIQRARRADIVAAVTERLYSSKKIFEDSNTITGTTASTPASEGRSPESTDVKLASTTRMRLQEISRKMLAKRRRICVDTQTDNQQTVRVKDVASLTEEPEVISKDASVLTDRHEDYETIPSTSSPVLRVKEISTLTDFNPQVPAILCKDAAIVTDGYYEDYAIGSPKNHSENMSDFTNFSRNSLFSAEVSDLCGNHDPRIVKSVDHSTNTRKPSGKPDAGSQTRTEDITDVIERCPCYKTRCCVATKHCHGSGGLDHFDHSDHSDHLDQNQSHPHTEKNVISISLPDMVNITIESSNGLESMIKVFDGSEIIDEKTPVSLKDNSVQTDAKDALEMGTSTDDIFGKISFDDFSPTKPIIAQTDGKSFRIENIFHEAGNATRINPRIEIISDLSHNDVKTSLTVTNSVGTFFVPETRENATGMDRGTSYGFGDRIGAANYKRSLTNNSFVKNTWPGQRRNRVTDSRRKSIQSSSFARNNQSLANPSMAKFDCEVYNPDSDTQKAAILGFNAEGLAVRDLDSQKNSLERRKPGIIVSKTGQIGESINGLVSPSIIAMIDQISGLEQDTNFSDDSLDPMEDGNKNCRENGRKACPPDVVAHTKKDTNEASTLNKNSVESEDFEDSQLIVFPKTKVDSTLLTNFTTPINDFKSLILGDTCCIINQTDDTDFTDSGHQSTSNTFSQDSTVCYPNDTVAEAEKQFCSYSGRPDEPKSIIKKAYQRTKSQSPDECERNCGSKNLECRNPYTKKVHFAVPEVFEMTSSDSEIYEKLTSEDETEEEGARNILEEYLDEAVVFMRNMNSMNEYMSAACAFDKYAFNERNRRREKAKSLNYIEYEGRRVSLNEETDADFNSEDEDLNFNVESYEKCLKSMDRLEECLAKVKRHDEILRDNYGIKVGGSTGAKLDLAKSSVDSREANGEDKLEYLTTPENPKDKEVDTANESVDGENNNLPRQENDSRYPGCDDGREILKKSRPRGYCRFSDMRQKEPTTYLQLKGRLSGLAADNQFKKKENFLGFGANVEPSKIDASNVASSDVDSLQSSGCYFALPKTKRIVMGPSGGIKSSTSRPRFSLSKYDSSNESSSSNEALETFMESIDIATRSRDKFKYPGSPRSKFLQLLSERRRIVENTRNTGFS